MERRLLVESSTITSIRKPLDESATVEKGKWIAPVWKLDIRNLNGRIYPTALAERIVKESSRTIAYDGHEAAYQSGAEYSIAKAVCSNPRIEDGCLWGDIDFVDDAYRERLETLVSKGIAIGVSSCGYGDIDDEGVVIPEAYELVRFLDFVTSPAGEVYAKMNNEDTNARREKPSAPMGEKEAKAMAELRTKVAESIVEYIL